MKTILCTNDQNNIICSSTITPANVTSNVQYSSNLTENLILDIFPKRHQLLHTIYCLIPTFLLLASSKEFPP